MDQNRSRGWRDSGWNRGQEKEAAAVRRRGLTLEAGGAARPGLGSGGWAQQRSFGSGAASVFGYLAAPWLAPVHRRYRTGNWPLMRLLDGTIARLWPLAFLDEMFTWIEDGSAASRMLVGSALAATFAALLSMHWPPLDAVQSIPLQPVFAGHGMTVLVAATFLIGAVILPALLGRVLATLLRLCVLVTLGAFTALAGYAVWLLGTQWKS